MSRNPFSQNASTRPPNPNRNQQQISPGGRQQNPFGNQSSPAQNPFQNQTNMQNFQQPPLISNNQQRGAGFQQQQSGRFQQQQQGGRFQPQQQGGRFQQQQQQQGGRFQQQQQGGRFQPQQQGGRFQPQQQGGRFQPQQQGGRFQQQQQGGRFQQQRGGGELLNSPNPSNPFNPTAVQSSIMPQANMNTNSNTYWQGQGNIPGFINNNPNSINNSNNYQGQHSKQQFPQQHSNWNNNSSNFIQNTGFRGAAVGAGMGTMQAKAMDAMTMQRNAENMRSVDASAVIAAAVKTDFDLDFDHVSAAEEDTTTSTTIGGVSSTSAVSTGAAIITGIGGETAPSSSAQKALADIPPAPSPFNDGSKLPEFHPFGVPGTGVGAAVQMKAGFIPTQPPQVPGKDVSQILSAITMELRSNS